MVDKRYRKKRVKRYDDLKFKVQSKQLTFEDKSNFVEFQIEDLLNYFKGSKL